MILNIYFDITSLLIVTSIGIFLKKIEEKKKKKIHGKSMSSSLRCCVFMGHNIMVQRDAIINVNLALSVLNFLGYEVFLIEIY